VGISRAVRVGNVVAVSGTAPLGADGRTVGQGDPATQARRCLEIMQVTRFIDPDWLVEFEAGAVIDDAQ
jgi:hypothetical protein